VFDRALKQMRDMVRARRYIVTQHAEEEMADDDMSIYDVEHAVLTGKIIARQKDRQTGEWKYLVQGRPHAGDDLVVVVKIGPTRKLVIVTVYLA
jgi:hypothetical protein